MEQKELERAALWFATKKTGGSLSSNRKNDTDKLRRTLEEARRARDQLLNGDSNQEYHITTVGKVIQGRVQLEKLEKEKVDYIKRRRNVDGETRVSRVDPTRANEEAALRRARVLKLSERALAFRLTGVSCFSVGGRPGDLGLRFDATWGGHYFDEKYYIVLSGPKLEVHRHTLPYFIPINELSSSFLPADPSQFCRRISRYVCAFSGRRALAKQLSDDFHGIAKVESSESLDVITLTGQLRARGNRRAHAVQLKFENMLDIIPHKANVFFLQSDGTMSVFRLDLDRIPSDMSSLQFFNYTLWVTSALDRDFDKGERQVDAKPAGTNNGGEEDASEDSEDE